MKIRKTGWVVIALAAGLITLAIVVGVASRTEPLRRLVVATLQERLDSDVELAAFSVDTLPHLTVWGQGLKIRLRGVDPSLPPLIEIDSFTVHGGIFDLVRRPRRFKHVVLEGLVVNIPPGGLKKHDAPTTETAREARSRHDAEDKKAHDVKVHDMQPPAAAPPPVESRSGTSGKDLAAILVEELKADGALLRIIPRLEGKPPKEFAIHTLTMTMLGRGQQMPFKATLTNPIPKGLIDTVGTFGPWQTEDPGTTPLGGRYTFEKADLNTIKGISGILDSEGEFSGALERIAVKGETRTPDFAVDISGQPVSLATKFEAVVDGTDGDTYLNGVDATFLGTSLFAKGAVIGTKGVKGRTVKLHVQITKGRIEDLLRLSTKSAKPMLVGAVALHTDFNLPPGEPDVIERLQLAGEFDVSGAQFTDAKTKEKLGGLSLRARGRDPQEEKASNVVSDLKGHFKLGNAVLSFSQLSFTLPGATVTVAGTYGLQSEALAFDGSVRMQATISQAAGGGVKGFFLKAVDPIFRKKGAGALIPIKIGGTAHEPKFGLDVGRVFKGK